MKPHDDSHAPRRDGRTIFEEKASMRRFRCTAILAAGAALILGACASSTLDSVWRDPTYGGPPFVKAVVFAWVERPSIRRTVEDVFVAELTRRGVAALASYTLIPDARDVNRASMQQAAKSSGADSVLVTRLSGLESEFQNEPVQAFVTSDPADMFQGYPIGSAPVYVQTQSQVANVLTNFFDARTGNMVWWGRTNASATRNLTALTRGLAGTVIGALRSAKLL
jgi:hypothetical protein